MARGLKSEGLSGALWASVDAGQVRTGAAGVGNASSGAPLRPDSRMHVGSIAKTVLAAGVLRLVSSGRLTLDTPLTSVLPRLALENRWQASDPVRIRHLLAHTAGLENVRLWQAFSVAPGADTPLAAALGDDPSLLRVRTRPGSRYAYSSLGYTLLGMVIEAVSGERYERYLDTALLRPLAMRDSTFAFRTQAGPHANPYADPLLAMGHLGDGAAQRALPMYLRPAGQFTTTAADMARFAIFLMGDGRIDGQAFIAPKLLGALGRPAGTEAALAGLRIGHGLALALRDRHQVLGACHPGTYPGFRVMLCLYPDQGKAFFVAFNTDSESADYDGFNRALINALGLRRTGAPAGAGARLAAPELAQWQGIYIPAASQMARLAWVDSVFNFVVVRADGARLRLHTISGAKTLEAAGAMLFRAAGRSQPSHVQLKSEDGVRVLSDGLHNYTQTSWAAMLGLWSGAALGMAGLLYVLLAGLWQAGRRRMRRSSALFLPLCAVLALLLPLPFFFNQSLLQLGERTPASLLLALVSGLLPLGIGAGLVAAARQRAARDGAALLAALHWLLVLAAWDLLPLALWR